MSFEDVLEARRSIRKYQDKEIDIPFCISWANEPWTKAWVGNERKTLIAQFYGNEDEWKEHFEYLLPFFNDERYIKEDNKPLFIIYRPEIIPCLNNMLDYWQKLAKENGLAGIHFVTRLGKVNTKQDLLGLGFDAVYQTREEIAINGAESRPFDRLIKEKGVIRMNIEKIQNELSKKYGGRVKATLEGDIIRLTGSLDRWEDVFDACATATTTPCICTKSSKYH